MMRAVYLVPKGIGYAPSFSLLLYPENVLLLSRRTSWGKGSVKVLSVGRPNAQVTF